MPSYYYTKFQKNPCVGRNERCPFHGPKDVQATEVRLYSLLSYTLSPSPHPTTHTDVVYWNRLLVQVVLILMPHWINSL